MATLDELRKLTPGAAVRVDHQTGLFAALSSDGRTVYVKFRRRRRSRMTYVAEECAPEAVEIVRERAEA